MFYFIFKNIKSLLKGLHIEGDVITFYYRHNDHSKIMYQGRPIPLPQLNIFTVLEAPLQSNEICQGLPYQFHGLRDIEHTLKNIHPKGLPRILSQKDEHLHMCACDVITPDELRACLNQINDIQSNTTLRLELLNTSHITFLKNFADQLGTELREDINYDLISLTDSHDLLTAYTSYFDKNKETIYKNFELIEKRIFQYKFENDWEYKAITLANTAWHLAKQSTIISFAKTLLDEVLHKVKIPKVYADILSGLLNLSLMAFLSTSWYPLIVFITILTIMQLCLGIKADLAVTVSHILVVIISMAEQFPLDGFSALNFGIGLLSSSTSYIATQNLTQYAFSTLCDRLGFAAKKSTTVQPVAENIERSRSFAHSE